MATIDKNLYDIGYMDTLAAGGTDLHRLDPRAKLITTLMFVSMVVSLGKYEISMMIPFIVYPLAMIVSADLPVLYLLKKIMLVAPFAVMIGIFNPLMDREPLLQIGSLYITGGWVSFFSIMMRFVLQKLVGLGLDPCSIWTTLERHMKCGVGICGHCHFEDRLVCWDGPVFSMDQLPGLENL